MKTSESSLWRAFMLFAGRWLNPYNWKTTEIDPNQKLAIHVILKALDLWRNHQIAPSFIHTEENTLNFTSFSGHTFSNSGFLLKRREGGERKKASRITVVWLNKLNNSLCIYSFFLPFFVYLRGITGKSLIVQKLTKIGILNK